MTRRHRCTGTPLWRRSPPADPAVPRGCRRRPASRHGEPSCGRLHARGVAARGRSLRRGRRRTQSSSRSRGGCPGRVRQDQVGRRLLHDDRRDGDDAAQPRSRIPGSEAWHVAIVESRLRSNAAGSRRGPSRRTRRGVGRRRWRRGCPAIDRARWLPPRRTRGRRRRSRRRRPGDCVAAEAAGCVADAGLFATTDHHPHALARQRLRGGEPEPDRGRRHGRRASLQSELHDPPFGAVAHPPVHCR
jgi:hypothetical protein